MTDTSSKTVDNYDRWRGGPLINAQTSTMFDLAEVRRNSGKSLEHIAEATKISVRFLEAIEAEEFQKLPGGIFALNYLRQYARCIGFDESILIEHCRNIIDPESMSARAAEAVLGRAPQPIRILPAIPVVRVRIRLSLPRLIRLTRQFQSQFR